MAAELPRLDLPAEEGARLLVLSRIAEVQEASARLVAGADPEALHDFRVALRRLRSVTRAFRPWLQGGPRRRDLKQVKRLAGGTGAARDAEVQLAWLGEQRERLPAERRAGLEWLVARYEAIRDGEEGRPAGLARKWRKVSGRLRARLSSYERRIRPLDIESLGGVLGALIRGQLESFLAAVSAIEGPEDTSHAHRARIEGKRLRYLLEPLRAREDLRAQEPVKRMKHLQDLLGELHDAHVLEAEIERARKKAVKAGTRPPALSPVTRLLRARRDRLHGAVARSGEELQELALDVARLATALGAAGKGREQAALVAVASPARIASPGLEAGAGSGSGSFTGSLPH